MADLKQYRMSAGSAAELVRNIEAAVAGGELAPGQPLPSVRRLAVEVGLSPVTVAAGLAELRPGGPERPLANPPAGPGRRARSVAWQPRSGVAARPPARAHAHEAARAPV